MRRWVSLLVLLVFPRLSFAAEESALRLTEFAAGGRQGVRDEDGDTPDWIEIQNISSNSISLHGWQLSVLRHKAWTFPGTNLPAGKSLVIFASGKDRSEPGHALHANFKLSAQGGTLLLRGPGGESSNVTDYPRQLPGVTFGIAAAPRSKPPAKVEAPEQTFHSYLFQPTPGKPNSAAIFLGPIITEISHTPALPTSTDTIVVTAKIPRANRSTKVMLHYRIMFEAERELAMLDDGEHHDGAANDGTFAGILSNVRFKPGQMFRYCAVATDEKGNTSRWPIFADRPGYSAYEGTIFAAPSTRSKLSVLQIMAGKETAIFYGGELYDNVSITAHGQISRNFPKPSFNIEFPIDHPLKYRAGEGRVSEVKILGNFGDKSKIRNTLSYEMIAAAGSKGHFAFPVRIEQNGKFFCVAELVEDGDDRWLSRVGLDPEGALYKMYGNLEANSEAEKKTRKWESTRDLSIFAAAIAENRSLEQRAAYAYDHIDIPQCISYFAALTLIGSGDHGHKNFYVYRDSRGTKEWALLPWDVDLTWGRNWTGRYFDDEIYVDNPLTLYRAGRGRRGRNPLYNLFFEHPEFRQMYLRRLRTVMDEVLQAPGTPGEKLIIEKRIHEWMDLLDPPGIQESDADLDSARWPTWGTNRSAREEAERIATDYLPGRRNFLFKSGRASLHGDKIPDSQPSNLSLKITQAERAAEAIDQYVSIRNENSFAVDLSGWKLSGGGIEHRFRPGTVLPSGKTIFVASNVTRFRRKSPFADKSPFVQGNWEGALAKEGEIRLTTGAGMIAAKNP